MDFRRSGQLDERRRRVLMDEIASPAEADSSEAAPAAGGGSAKGPVRAYCPAVLAERQPRVTDLVPVRPFLVTVLALLALLGIAAIETIHVYARTTPLTAGVSQLAALDVSHRGSLAAWYSSVLLAAAAMAALAVYTVRQHRVDDYAGRYRIWLWAAAALAFGSLDAATGLHDVLGWGLALLAGTQADTGPTDAACTLAWLAVYTLVFGTLAVRLAIETWPSLPGFAGLATVGLLYFLGALTQLGMMPLYDPLMAEVLASVLTLLGHLTLAMSVVLFARHVHLDAQGRLKVYIDPDRNKKAKARTRTKLKVVNEDDDAGRPATSASAKNGPPSKFGAAASSPKATASISKGTSSPVGEDDDADDEYGDDKLSKAERRRLKKLARRETQRRAA
jgi:hypothetical protein